MRELTTFTNKYDRFLNALLSAIDHFRKGEDHLGLDHLLNSLLDLEMILKSYPYPEVSAETLGEIVSVMEQVYITIKNQDMIALTDTLEFKLYPLTKM